MPLFDLPGALRRIRRSADLSQRELAALLSVPKSTVGAAESRAGGLDARILARAAALAGLRLVLVDEGGTEVAGMADAAVRDQRGRRYPAHLDTRYGNQYWWHGPDRYSRDEPWYTFDRVRYTRDFRRERLGTPEDHQLPQPGDSPAERRAARRRAAEQRRRDEVERRFLAGELRDVGPDVVCTCPPRCAELDVGERPVHAAGCPCECDIG